MAFEANNFFCTPVWFDEGDLIEGALEWALNHRIKNPESVNYSNRGGYQSEALGIDDFPFASHIIERINFLPPYFFRSIWININGKGDHNATHTHPDADLAMVWYLTDNGGLLGLSDPMMHMRHAFRELGGGIGSTMMLDCKAGNIVAFPAYVPHLVEPNPLDTERVSVAFNISLKNS